MPLTAKQRQILEKQPGRRAHLVSTGQLVEITYTHSGHKKPRPWRRGKIMGFTLSSRLRMLRTINMISWENTGKSLFITLTYPDSKVENGMTERNKERYLFMRSVENYLQRKVGALWRIEWQTRKSGPLKGQLHPHVHLLVFNVPFLPHADVRLWWRSALRVDGHLTTHVALCQNASHVAKYVAKYCAKLPEASSLVNASYLNNQGRHWGIHRRPFVPFGQQIVFTSLTASEVRLAENFACSVMPHFVRGSQTGFALFGNKAERLADEIERRRVDDDPFMIYDDPVS